MKGWLIWAYDTSGDQYLRAATILANSIKATQKHNNTVAVVVNQQASLSETQRELFDYIIPVHTDRPKEIMTLGYALSPFQETISIEADCIVCSDVSHWWNVLGQHDILFPGQVQDVCGNTIVDSYYRRGFNKHGLAEIWSGMFYWQKSAMASNLFKSATTLGTHWFDTGMPFEWTENAANDEIFASVLSQEQYQICIDTAGFFTFTHNRTHDQPQYLSGQELTSADFNVTPKGVWIGPWRQQGVLHYHHKHWATVKIEQQVGAWNE